MSRRRAESPARFLGQVLESLRAGLVRRSALRGVLWASAGGLGALAVLLLADAAWGFAPSARFAVYFAALTCIALGVGAAALAAWVRRPSLFYMAHQVERRCPELKNALVTFLELSAETREDPSFAEAVARRAARVLARRDPSSLAPPEPLRRPAIAAACTAAALGVGLWLSQGILFEPWVESAQATLASAGAPTSPFAAAENLAAANPAQQEELASAAGAPDATSTALAKEIAAQAETFERLAAALENSASDGVPSAPDAASANKSGRGSPGEPTAEAVGSPGAAENPRTGDGGNAGASRPAESSTGPDSAQAAGGAGTSAEAGDETGAETSEQTDAGAASGAESQRPATADAGAAGNPGTGGGSTGGPPRTEAAGDILPPRPQPTELPENPLDTTRWADRLIREADRRLRDGDVTDAFLGEMGMSQADLRRFVTAWKRRLEATRGPVATETPGATTVRDAQATGELVRAAAAQGRPILDDGPDAAASDVVQDDPGRVAARFRPAVSAYFAEVERLAGRRKEPKP